MRFHIAPLRHYIGLQSPNVAATFRWTHARCFRRAGTEQVSALKVDLSIYKPSP
jgi:hypothetical protein